MPRSALLVLTARRARWARPLLVVTLAAPPSHAFAQAPVGSRAAEYARLLQLTGARTLSSRTIQPSLAADGVRDTARWADPWRDRRRDETPAAGGHAIQRLPVMARAVQNSAVPAGTNDDALWAGRGATLALDAGVGLRLGGLSVRLAPTLWWSENRDFALAPLADAWNGTSPDADPWISARIDRPQRFGDRPFARLTPGQSVVRYDGHGVSAAVGTESLWWGPGLENALLLTNNAPGVPHVALGTAHALPIGIGTVEAQYLVGRLTRSRYWRATAPDSTRWMSGLAVTFAPHGAPGLYVGGGRVFYAYVPAGGLRRRDYTEVLQPFQKKKLASATNPGGDDRADQMLSLWARYVIPAAGLELYGEWGRNDHSWDTRDFLVEPEQASAYVVGAQKVVRQETGFLRLRAELTSLAQGRTADVRPVPTWYGHFVVREGYTQDGQVIGAGIGPGSNAQGFHVEWFRSWGSVGLDAGRWRDNDDAFYAKAIADTARLAHGTYVRHDVWTTAGARGTVFLGPVDLDLRLENARERNRYSVYRNDLTNWHGELRVTWR